MCLDKGKKRNLEQTLRTLRVLSKIVLAVPQGSCRTSVGFQESWPVKACWKETATELHTWRNLSLSQTTDTRFKTHLLSW